VHAVRGERESQFLGFAVAAGAEEELVKKRAVLTDKRFFALPEVVFEVVKNPPIRRSLQSGISARALLWWEGVDKP